METTLTSLETRVHNQIESLGDFGRVFIPGSKTLSERAAARKGSTIMAKEYVVAAILDVATLGCYAIFAYYLFD